MSVRQGGIDFGGRGRAVGLDLVISAGGMLREAWETGTCVGGVYLGKARDWQRVCGAELVILA